MAIIRPRPWKHQSGRHGSHVDLFWCLWIPLLPLLCASSLPATYCLLSQLTTIAWPISFLALVTSASAFTRNGIDPMKPKVAFSNALFQDVPDTMVEPSDIELQLICDPFTLNVSNGDFPIHQRVDLDLFLDLLNDHVNDCSVITHEYARLNPSIEVTINNIEQGSWVSGDRVESEAYTISTTHDDEGIYSLKIAVNTKSGLVYALLAIERSIESFNRHYLPILSKELLSVHSFKPKIAKNSTDLIYGLYLRVTSVDKSPQYSLRAFELDTSADYLSVDQILTNIDLAAMSRMNAMVWTFYSSSSFSFVLDTDVYRVIHGESCVPATKTGCAGLICEGCGYNREDVNHIIDYARDHGIDVHFDMSAPNTTGGFFPAEYYTESTCTSSLLADPFGVQCFGPVTERETTCASSLFATPLHCRQAPCFQINLGIKDTRHHRENAYIPHNAVFKAATAIMNYLEVLRSLESYFLLYPDTFNDFSEPISASNGDYLMLFVGLHASACLVNSYQWQIPFLQLLINETQDLRVHLVVSFERLADVADAEDTANYKGVKVTLLSSHETIVPTLDNVTPSIFRFINDNKLPYVYSIPNFADLSCAPWGHPAGIGVPDSKCNTRIALRELYRYNDPNGIKWFDSSSESDDSSLEATMSLTTTLENSGNSQYAMGTLARMDGGQLPASSYTSAMWPRASVLGHALWNPNVPPRMHLHSAHQGMVNNFIDIHLMGLGRWTFGAQHHGYEVSSLYPLYCYMLPKQTDCVYQHV